MMNLKNAKEAAANNEMAFQARIVELNKLLETRDHEIIVIGKKIMKVSLYFKYSKQVAKLFASLCFTGFFFLQN